MNKPYTEEQYEFIKSHCISMTCSELLIAYNEKFHDTRTKKGLQSYMQSKQLTTVRPKRLGVFKPEHQEFMMKYGSKMSRKELTTLLNQKFETTFCVSTVKSWCVRNNISSPNGDGKFTSETSPRWQVGLSKEEFKSHYSKESFYLMTKPMMESNIKYKIGDELIRHGAPYIVVNNEFGDGIDHRIKKKSIYVWEQCYGSVPKDSIIIHADNNKMNCDICNLRCIPSKYRAYFHHNDWWNAPKEIKDAAIKWCELYYTLKESVK